MVEFQAVVHQVGASAPPNSGCESWWELRSSAGGTNEWFLTTVRLTADSVSICLTPPPPAAAAAAAEVQLQRQWLAWSLHTPKFGVLYVPGCSRGSLGLFFSSPAVATKADVVFRSLTLDSRRPTTAAPPIPQLTHLHWRADKPYRVTRDAPALTRSSVTAALSPLVAPAPDVSSASSACTPSNPTTTAALRRTPSGTPPPRRLTWFPATGAPIVDAATRAARATSVETALPALGKAKGKPQFGQDLTTVPVVYIDGYGEVPEVLVGLGEQLRAHDGFSKEGIFRVAASKARLVTAKAAIDATGSFDECDCAHTVANLIKQWFRELPQSFFQIVPEAEIGAATVTGVRCACL